MPDLVKETGAGLSTANTYADLDDGDVYHEFRLFASTWTGAADEVREPALLWATKLLDKLMEWNGDPATSDQALRWPREGAYNQDGVEIESDVIPQDIIDATCEFARILIATDRTADVANVGMKSFKAGSLSISWDKADRMSMLPKSVWVLVRPYGVRAGSRSGRILERM
jgi:hypothetical protein